MSRGFNDGFLRPTTDESKQSIKGAVKLNLKAGQKLKANIPIEKSNTGYIVKAQYKESIRERITTLYYHMGKGGQTDVIKITDTQILVTYLDVSGYLYVELLVVNPELNTIGVVGTTAVYNSGYQVDGSKLIKLSDTKAILLYYVTGVSSTTVYARVISITGPSSMSVTSQTSMSISATLLPVSMPTGCGMSESRAIFTLPTSPGGNPYNLTFLLINVDSVTSAVTLIHELTVANSAGYFSYDSCTIKITDSQILCSYGLWTTDTSPSTFYVKLLTINVSSTTLSVLYHTTEYSYTYAGSGQCAMPMIHLGNGRVFAYLYSSYGSKTLQLFDISGSTRDIKLQTAATLQLNVLNDSSYNSYKMDAYFEQIADSVLLSIPTNYTIEIDLDMLNILIRYAGTIGNYPNLKRYQGVCLKNKVLVSLPFYGSSSNNHYDAYFVDFSRMPMGYSTKETLSGEFSDFIFL